ncbi:cysteine-rich receptor-like protein kinase 43 [Impatiens glandulifera]|uniref:cysteine-rich receptor-like protein kinase 43 n=1 Tax=Impatiens glandulifera TaxID=253017 RepID=UPI001FB0772E|nr:cysteine-rich receptor-like protein kinase 43 [Impatiens glandulifera]
MGKSGDFVRQLAKAFKLTSSGKDAGGGEAAELERIAAQEHKHFSFETLVTATRDFHPENKLGQGGFGPVYKGRLKDGREIAVKKLAKSSNQGKTEFLNEAKLLSRVQHRNVVNLLGYCLHASEKLLVYEYVVNESLEKFLFKAEKRHVLDWKRRFIIISGVAKGLHYLHEDAHKIIIHRDIKASNILLDDKWIPKISDFGMAHLFPEDQTHVNTRVAGTNGYMAPEYQMNGCLTMKVDVFSFGVVVLELLCGQKNTSFNMDPKYQNLIEWVYKTYKKGKALEVVDPMLAETADADQVVHCILIGLLCVQADPHKRPTMNRVVVMLSKRPGTIEQEPTRPGLPGSRYRTSQRSNTRSSASGDGSYSSSHTSDSTRNSNTDTGTTFDTSYKKRSIDPHGKRPIEG